MKTRMLGIVLVLLGCVMLAWGVEDVTSIIQEYPLYKELANNETVSQQFLQYMEWASDKSPDGKLVFELIKNKASSLEAITTIFHEKVEFAEWLKLGHRFEDILTVEYYQQHYMEVYPIAHRRALIAEIALLRYFAQKKGFRHIPESAYNLVHPLIEKYNLPVMRFQKRMQFNWEYQAQLPFLAESDIDIAIQVYEAGGYEYKDKNKILSEAKAIIANAKP